MLNGFSYTVPATVAEATAALAATTGSRALAGGQLLLPAMKVGRQSPPLLVDLRRIDALRGIDADNGTLRIGALTTFDELLNHVALGRQAALLEALRATGDPQLRNRATVGGFLATRAVPSDLAAALLLAEATVTIAGPAGERSVTAAEFFADQLAAGAIVTAVRLPGIPAGAGSAYEKLADRASGVPICGVAVAVSRGRGGRLDMVGIAVTGATHRPRRLADAERALAGSGTPVDTSNLPVGPPDAFVDNDQASAGYRAHLTRVLIGRAIARS